MILNIIKNYLTTDFYFLFLNINLKREKLAKNDSASFR